MLFEECFLKKKEKYDKIILFLENDSNEDKIEEKDLNFQDIFSLDDEFERKTKMKEILYTISKITNNHQRHPHFYKRVEQIFLILKDHLKPQFTNIELFNIFRNNKRMILFLFEQKIIEIKKSNKGSITKYFRTKKDVPIDDKTSSTKKKMKTKSNLNTSSLILFFYPELQKFLDEKDQKSIEDKLKKIDSTIDFKNFDQFNKKRREGENDSYICSLIRADSIEEFVAYVNRTNLSLTSKIKPSIYETNSFLIKNEPTLIEYAAFFGSIQIIQYLKYNNVTLTSSLWLYTIHSKNAELIHFLEENNVKPEHNQETTKEPFEDAFIESIKCHHNDIAVYIKDQLFEIITDVNENITSFILRYYNYCFFPNQIDRKIFVYLCEFDYFELVEILAKERKINKKYIMVTKSISKSIF